jgi:ABC-type branched-subunit amino acid transport system substrate-binding protein
MARFVKAYTATLHNVPGPQAIQAYAGMRLTLAAMDASPSMSPKDLIASLEKTSVDTVVGKLAIRKQDHQGTVGTYFSETVAMKDSPYGAKVGWKVIEPLPWDMVKVDAAQTGCKEL